MFLPDKLASHREVLRIIEPGGSYVLSIWGEWATNPFAHIALEATVSFFPENPPGFYKVPLHYRDDEEISDTLKPIGFVDVCIDHMALDEAITSFADLTTGLVRSNPLYDEIRDRRGVDPEEEEAKILENLQSAFGADGSTIPLQVIFVRAMKPA
jgi:hypothetical protein